MSDLEGVGLVFKETMSGWIGKGKTDFAEGETKGKTDNTPISFKVSISISNLAQFLDISHHYATLTGTVSAGPFGDNIKIRDGRFGLFTINPETGHRQMSYTFRFNTREGREYFLRGFKVLKDDPGFDLLDDMTTLYTTIHSGPNESAPVYGAGIMRFRLTNTLELMKSLKVLGAGNFWQAHQARTAFISFVFGQTRNIYFRKVNPLYATSYENLVLSGRVRGRDGLETDFFLVSGVHDKDFPWGDGEVFSDVLLVIGREDGGYRRFCLSERTVPGLALDVRKGQFRYHGTLYEIASGCSTSFSKMKKAAMPLVPVQAEFKIDFQADAYTTTPLPFLTAENVFADLAAALKAALEKYLPSERLLGIFITPHTVKARSGSLSMTKGAVIESFKILPQETFGEAERSTIRNVKYPVMLYHYICGVQHGAHRVRVQIMADTMRNTPQYWIKDQVEALIGDVVCHLASKEILMENGSILVGELTSSVAVPTGRPKLFETLGPPVLEVNNDHFPTAVFQRRIIKVRDPDGTECLALEEHMNPLRLEALNSGRTARVAVAKDQDKFKALEEVLEGTGFRESLEDAWKVAKKPKQDFLIALKPNFMFAYNKHDHSTFTDPELVEHLVGVMRDQGFEKIKVVEAQSTYGEYFTRRSVKEVAGYLGFDLTGAKGYEVVDLTLDHHEPTDFGPHLKEHPAPRTWKEADYRISFAKNKTHAYAYYTLTLKNIYGALPMGNKFKEYHCDRDIYHTTVEYLKAFPVHYALIDAHLSADGPFGIFADSEPNPTLSVIGGDDLVAVDWVGASKMGLDPMISDYMRLAVEAFGKPEIIFSGDPGPYWPWLNVPRLLTLLTHEALDADYYFGNLIYMSAAFMDDTQFKLKSKNKFIKAARLAMRPIQEAVFKLPGGERTVANRILGRFLTWLGEQ